ncbi:MAG: ABC transporter permease subunit [Acidimicrobiales bacterium]|nr:ABC transporter permease subunit [Acidimicrobiales bacterium]
MLAEVGARETAPSFELVQRFLADRRKGLSGWAVGLTAYTVLIVSFFPMIRDSASMAQAIEEYPDAMKEFLGGEASFNMSSGPGFLNAELYSVMLPILLSVFAIGFGASMGADQRSGLMDLLLSHPISRGRIVAEKAIAMVVGVTGLATVVFATVIAAGAFIDLGISVSNLVAATVGVVLLVTLHGLIAMAVGAATGRRSAAIGTATTLLAAGYIFSGLGGLVDWLEPVRSVSPYYRAIGTSPMLNGWAFGSLVYLLALGGALVFATKMLFERRDIV